MTQAEAKKGLNAGRTLVVDRRDCPLLPWLEQQVRAGALTREVVEYDQQATAWEYRKVSK